MNHRVALVVLVAASVMSGAAVAQDKAAPKTRARGGVAVQIDVAGGGDEITVDNGTASPPEAILGEGMTVSLGGFYRLSESKPWELQAFVGYKRAWIVPVQGGGGYDRSVSRWVFQLLANYRPENRWYFGGGLTFHGDPTFENVAPGYLRPSLRATLKSISTMPLAPRSRAAGAGWPAMHLH